MGEEGAAPARAGPVVWGVEGAAQSMAGQDREWLSSTAVLGRPPL
jgi:hypothetical protein